MKYLFLIITVFYLGTGFYANALRYSTSPIITAGSMGASTNSIGIDLNQILNCSIQAVWTGTPTGTLKIQVSNDNVPYGTSSNPSANVVNWTDYTGSSQSLSGSAGNFVWNMLDSGYRWIRLVYTRSSGTGTINAAIVGKGI